MLAKAKEGPLIVRDSVEEYDLLIYVNARDDTGQRQVVSARGRVPSNLTFCTDHFIARGVCVDCTQALGHVVYAS
jgi:hypothetical protein